MSTENTSDSEEGKEDYQGYHNKKERSDFEDKPEDGQDELNSKEMSAKLAAKEPYSNHSHTHEQFTVNLCER